MAEFKHQEFIDRPAAFVFAGGLDTSLWPNLHNLSLEARTALLEHGTDIEAAISELGQHIPIDCAVTKLEEGRHLAIEGESDRAKIYLSLNFTQDDELGDSTKVDALLRLTITDFKTRIALGGIVSHVAKRHLKNFGEGFKANIEALPADHDFAQVAQAS